MPNIYRQSNNWPALCGFAGKAALAFLMLLTIFSRAVLAQTPPGAAFPNTSELSDQKPGSILVYNYYTSNADTPATTNTELNLTNTHPTTAVTVRLFFIAGAGSVANLFLTVAPRQTVSYLASSIDPGVTGFVIAVAVNSATGCPINFNHLAGDAFIKLSTGHAAGLQAVAISAIAGSPATCGGASTPLNFDGVNYNKLPRVEAMNNFPSIVDGNSTLFILNRIGGDLTVGAATLGTIFGLVHDDAENLFSFSFSGGSQFVNTLSTNFPRTAPRLENIVPTGRSGWLKVYGQSEIAILGASLNFNSNSGSNATRYDNGQNFTHRTLTTNPTTLTIPVSAPTCSFGIAPSSANHPAGGGSGSVTVTAINGCLWTAVSNDSWITTTSAAFGNGNGALGYAVAANPGTTPRTGTLTIGGQTFTVMQAGNCGTVTIDQTGLPNGTVGTPYNQTLTASGGTPAYTFTVTAGALPNGLSLAAGGALTGTPSQAGTFNFTIAATDANTCAGSRAFTVTIAPMVVNNGLQFYPLPQPVRALETRAGFSGCTNPGAPINANGTFTLGVLGGCTGIPANAAAVTGNITVVPSGAGYLTLFPSSAAQPTVANSNFAAGEITNNVFTVGLGAGDGAFKIFSNATTEVIVDVTGYYAPPGAGGLYFHPLPSPVRLLETRAGFTGCIAPGLPLTGTGDPNSNPNLDFEVQGRSPVAPPCNSIPASAQVLVGNATSVFPSGGGYLTIYPSGGTRPTVASSNYAGGDVINGPFSVKLGADGKFKIYTFATTHLVVDILGYYSEDATDANGAGLLFNPLPVPVRLLETRPDFPGFPLSGCTRTNAPIPGNLAMATHTQQARSFCGLPASAQAVVGNVSVVNSTGAGFLTLFPGNLTTAPLVATSNYPAPATFGYNRHYFVGLGPADGTFKVLTQFTTDLILDASGYFAP